MSLTTNADNSAWEEEKKRKSRALKALKKSFQPAGDNCEALLQAKESLDHFLINHHQTYEETNARFNKIPLPDEIKKQEASIRKELNFYYKSRDNIHSKVFAIFLAYKHAELLLNNSNEDWKNFSGLQKLQSNWKSEEYFEGLLTLMHAFKTTFPNSAITEKLSKDIDSTFSLWNSRNNAQKVYESNIKSLPSLTTPSDQHFCLLGIIEYLERRYKFNPQYKEELINWCLKDVEIYEDFLKEFHEHGLFTIDDQMEFFNNPNLKKEKLSKITFDKVKHLKNYMVPRLNSYDVLEDIYNKDQNLEKLEWIRSIGKYIGYKTHKPTSEKKKTPDQELETTQITRTIEVEKSGQKGKLAFMTSAKEPCSTEIAFQDHQEQLGWNVMRGEVSFWQAMFCLAFWDEIFEGMDHPTQLNDIPYDLFQGDTFYLNRQKIIDSKYEKIKNENLLSFINNQLNKSKGCWTRLLYNGDHDMFSYAKSEIVQIFLNRIDSDIFAKIVYRIAQNPNENRAGLPDYIIWNDKEIRMVEVKKVREKIRDSQLLWLSWMSHENIPVEIVRVKGV